jgi:excisionase family DNA binding protein
MNHPQEILSQEKLTVKDAAYRIGVSVRTVQRLIASRQISPVLIFSSRHIAIPAQSLESYLASRVRF